MDVKVSVIMPSLNVKKYIEEAVRSVMGQTLGQIEIICIDAGSTDGTWEILTHLAKQDERIVLRRSEKKSYGYQVNMGMDMARGEYIAVLETDDYVSSKMYECLYQAAVEQDCDYVKGDCLAYWTKENGERFFFTKRNFAQNDLYDKVIQPGNYIRIATEDWYLWTGIYKKEFLKQNQIRLSETSGAAFQDIGFIYKTTVCAKRAVYLKSTNYRYCMDREEASSNSGKGLQYSYQEFSRLLETLPIVEEQNPNASQCLYCRMAKSFVCSYEESRKKNAVIGDEERKKYYQWFKEKLTDGKKRNQITSTNIQIGIWRKLEKLLLSEESYLETSRQWEDAIQKKLGKPGEFPVVVFGCGFYGYRAYGWMRECGYTIWAFMDNNNVLWGNRINEKVIEPPEKIAMWQKQGILLKYLVANELHCDEIQDQLLGMGVKREDIGIYRDGVLLV